MGIWASQHDNKSESSSSAVGESCSDVTSEHSAVELRRPFSTLPLELLEMLLMKTFIKFFVADYKNKNRMRDAEQLSFMTLSSVSRDWWQTLNGWPESNTRRWFRHETRRQLEHVCRPYALRPVRRASLQTEDYLQGITELDEEIYVVYYESDTIQIFNSRLEHFDDIQVEGLSDVTDIVVCRDSRVFYVGDTNNNCVWRVTATTRQLITFVPAIIPQSLSVTSRRLLVTSQDDDKLRLYGADGLQLKQVSLPDDMCPQHAVQTDNETFIVSHVSSREPNERRHHKLSEVDADGHVIRECSQQLYGPWHLALDVDGRVFVADCDNHRVLLLNKHLQLERILLDKEHDELHSPLRLCYVPETGRLLIGDLQGGVMVYSLKC